MSFRWKVFPVRLCVCPSHSRMWCKYNLFYSFLQRCLRWKIFSLAAWVFFPCVVRFLFFFSGLSTLNSWCLDGLRLTSRDKTVAHLLFQVAWCIMWFWMRLPPRFREWSSRFFSLALLNFALDMFVRNLVFLHILLLLNGLHVASLDCRHSNHLIQRLYPIFSW